MNLYSGDGGIGDTNHRRYCSVGDKVVAGEDAAVAQLRPPRLQVLLNSVVIVPACGDPGVMDGIGLGGCERNSPPSIDVDVIQGAVLKILDCLGAQVSVDSEAARILVLHRS